MLRFDGLTDGDGKLAIDADEIHRHQSTAYAGGILQNERLVLGVGDGDKYEQQYDGGKLFHLGMPWTPPPNGSEFFHFCD